MILGIKKRAGFTLMEVLVSSALATILMTSMVGAFVATANLWKNEDTRSQIRHGVENAMERIKEDVKLSDGSKILFYPSDASTYTAMSMPVIAKDGNGFFALSDSGTVDWSKAKTVIYHVTGGSHDQKEIRRTQIDSFNSDPIARQNILNDIASSANTPTSSGNLVLKTKALMKTDSASFEIKPTSPTFDGYSATTVRSGSINFGSIRMAPGTHQIRFEVTGKNSSSSGYKIGLDSIALSPSGGFQEAEDLTVAASSGQSSTIENMMAYGNWGGNQQRAFAASGVGNYITLATYYDQWLESDFASMLHDNTMVSGNNPLLTVLSREDQSLVPSWTASAQTLSGSVSTDSASSQSVRCVISGAYFEKSADMIRIKFQADPDHPLSIDEAYFGLRNTALPDSPNFSVAPTQLYFDNAPVTVDMEQDPVGATASPGVHPNITIPGGCYVWSNWFPYSIDTSLPVSDRLVSMYIPSGNATSWSPNPTGIIHSFKVNNNQAPSQGDWKAMGGYSPELNIFATCEIASWSASGTATSQVYDTKMTSPNYAQLSWTSTIPQNSSVAFKIRSSADSTMTGATAWEDLSSFSASPANLAALVKQRYVQFQVKLTGGSPFSDSPSVDNVKITWPGQEAIIQVSGIITKKSDYGKFKVLVDGQSITNALDVGIDIRKKDRGKESKGSLHVEVKPKNTGK